MGGRHGRECRTDTLQTKGAGEIQKESDKKGGLAVQDRMVGGDQ